MKCVDVIIPTYKPDQKFFQLLHRLELATTKDNCDQYREGIF